MTGLGALDNNTFKRIHDLLQAGYLRLGEIVIKRITVIKFGVDDRGGSDGGCFGIELTNVAKLTNMILAGFAVR